MQKPSYNTWMNGRHPSLPTPLTTLLGREQELATLRQLLQRPNLRLITITGPFGVGKTSLAIATTHAVQNAFADGVHFIPLAPISDQTLIIPTIIQTLGIPQSPRRLDLDILKEHLQNQKTLLVLDNFEQIIAAAPLLMELLLACPHLKLLVTSREPLHLRGEQQFLLSPLALPEKPDIEALSHYSSVALFVQRAQAAKFDFELTEQNAPSVVGICQLLDGLPLAIELAAARIRLFSPQAMLAQLQKAPLQLLRGGARDLPDRQQTLRRAVRWSYQLLNEAEQKTLRWLAVFVNGCSLEAITAVIGQTASLELVDSLVSKSLIRQVAVADVPRFTMLEMIREFGLEQLQETAELETARRLHADWYTALAEEAEPHLEGENRNVWLKRLELEKDNLRAAFRWTIENSEAELAMRLAATLRLFWFLNGRWSEGRRFLEDALGLTTDITPDPALLAKVLYQASFMAQYQGEYARARSLCEQSLALYRTLDNQFGLVMTFVRLARITLYGQDQKACQAYLAEAAALIDSLPDSVAKARAYRDIYLSKFSSPGPLTEQTIHYLTEYERIARKLNDLTELPLALTNRALLHTIQDDMTQANVVVKEARQLSQEINSGYINSRFSGLDLFIEIHNEAFDIARKRLIDMIESANQRNDFILALFLLGLACVLWRQNLPLWAAKVLGLANFPANNGENHPNLVWMERLPAFRGFYKSLRAELGEEPFAQALAAGRQMTVADLDAIPQPSVATVHKIDALTPRERDVLQLLAQELSNPQIAEQLVVSRRTVDAHLRSIYDKLGVKSRDAAIRVAQERGLLP